MSVRERDSQSRRREDGSSDSGVVYVTLTENREGHVDVSGEPDKPPPTPLPPSPGTRVSFLMA